MTDSNEPGLRADFFLVRFTQQLARNYARFDQRFAGGRIYFTVDNHGEIEPRTLVFDAEKPRLFTGYFGADDPPGYVYLHIKLTIEQLAMFFAGTLDPADPQNKDVVFDGNDMAFYDCVGRCL